MRDILPDLERWQRAGTQSAIARVVRVDGSGPREAGAAMAVSADGEVVGSVSVGALRARSSRRPASYWPGEKGRTG